MTTTPAYVQCICPKHGPTTWLHGDREKDDFCLLPAEPVSEPTDEQERQNAIVLCPPCFGERARVCGVPFHWEAVPGV